MEITINEENLQFNEIEEKTLKARAILINEQNQIIICNYGGVYLLPGGKVEDTESPRTAIIRELKEELGQSYEEKELTPFIKINYFQKNYAKRDGTFSNRLVQNFFYIGKYKPILNNEQQLTEKEKRDKFSLELVYLEDLENIVLHNTNNNPRNQYFQQELLIIINHLHQIKQNVKKQKLIK